MENIPIYYRKSKTEAIELVAQELSQCLGKMTHESLSIHPCDKFLLVAGSPDY